MTWARLSFAQQRWEVLILGLGVVVAIGLMAWMTSQLLGITAAYPECDFFLDEDQFALPANCDQASQAFYGLYSNAEIFLRNGWLFGFGVGLIVGVPWWPVTSSRALLRWHGRSAGHARAGCCNGSGSGCWSPWSCWPGWPS
ncbi:hypothetical protein BH23CHL9_BH23CHL9_12270 [soil metagenome]